MDFKNKQTDDRIIEYTDFTDPPLSLRRVKTNRLKPVLLVQIFLYDLTRPTSWRPVNMPALDRVGTYEFPNWTTRIRPAP